MQIVLDGVVGEHLPVFRHITDAGPCNGMGRSASHVDAADQHLAAGRRHDAHDRLQRGRFAGAIAPEQRDGLRLTHLQIDAEQDLALAVENIEAFRNDRIGAHGPTAPAPASSGRSPCPE